MGERAGSVRLVDGGRMSITKELRMYVQDWRDTPSLMDGLDRGDVDGILEDFIRIADRIDAEHAVKVDRLEKYRAAVTATLKENAKLRELLDYITPIAWHAASENERDRMYELGVEV